MKFEISEMVKNGILQIWNGKKNELANPETQLTHFWNGKTEAL